MCGRADDDFGPGAIETLSALYGPLWGSPIQRSEVRPTDPLRFVRRAGPRFEAPYGRWSLVPTGMTEDVG